MNFDDHKNDQQILRINIATKLCQSMIAHHGHYGKLEELVGDAYRGADEILKQGHPKFASKENEVQSWKIKSNINDFKPYGDNII